MHSSLWYRIGLLGVVVGGLTLSHARSATVGNTAAASGATTASQADDDSATLHVAEAAPAMAPR